MSPNFLVMKFVRFLLIFSFIPLLGVAATVSPGEPLRVESGLVAGVASDTTGVTVYRGIPFAAAPVGDLRWKPPVPREPWEGVLQADTYCKSCMQELRRSYLPWTEEYMLRNDVDEDCLAVNIWTPAKSSDEKLPVLVWIHGGAYFSGSGEVELYDGEGLAKKGMIVVTINYRLGVFGFLAHPELTAESPEGSSGNYALLDQIAALKWVKRNIAPFGGDPERITVGGQSAGAGAVHFLTASPQARGTFDRAIAQSGPWRTGSNTPDLAAGEKLGRDFAEAIGAPSLTELRALSADELYARYAAHEYRFRPIVDGWVVPDQVEAVFARGEQVDVPMLMGWTADEASSRAGYGESSVAEFAQRAQEMHGDAAAAFLALYPAKTDAEAGGQLKRSIRHRNLAFLRAWAKARGPTPDYGYLFERAIPWPEYPQYGAFHSAEMPYMFNNLRLMDRPWTEVDHRVAEEMSNYWVNFVATGNPNGPGLPRWPASDDRIMRFGEQTSADWILPLEVLEFYESAFANQN